MKKNIFLTGAPSAGKTTVIKKIIIQLTLPAKGFFTEEECVEGKRVGFMMKTLDGQCGYLGHQDFKSKFTIRRYGISIENIENVAVPSIEPKDNHIIILDEIAKMECFSDKFKTAALKSLDSPNIVIGTIAFGKEGFIKDVKARSDIDILEVTEKNRDSLPELILNAVHDTIQ